MREIIRSNDMVMVSYIVDLLRQEGCEPVVFDTHMSVLEGSIGVLPRRVMVAESEADKARRLLAGAGLREQLSSRDA